MTVKEYLRNSIITMDQALNVALGGFPDETLSSRFEHEVVIPFFGNYIKALLNHIDPGHTTSSYEYDDLGFPDPHHMPVLAKKAFDLVMAAGDDYLKLPEADLEMAEQWAKLQRLRESGMVHCVTCGRRV